MDQTSSSSLESVVVEETLQFSLVELCRVCGATREQLIALVDEDVLQPRGASPDEWLFSGASLRRARMALRLSRDLDLSPPAAALVLDLLDEIDALRSRLRRLGMR